MGDKISLSEIARVADRNGIVGNKDNKLEGENEIKFFEWMAGKEGYDTLEIQKFYKSGAVIEPEKKEEVVQQKTLLKEETVEQKDSKQKEEKLTKSVVKKPVVKKSTTKKSTTVKQHKAAQQKATSKKSIQPNVVQTTTTTKPQTTAAQQNANKKSNVTKQKATAQPKAAAKKAVAAKPQTIAHKKSINKADVQEPGILERTWKAVKNFFKSKEDIVPAEEVPAEEVSKSELKKQAEVRQKQAAKIPTTPREVFTEKAAMVLNDENPTISPMYGSRNSKTFEIKVRNLNSGINSRIYKQAMIIDVSDRGQLLSATVYDNNNVGYKIINGKIYKTKSDGSQGLLINTVDNQSAYKLLQRKVETLVKQYKKGRSQ